MTKDDYVNLLKKLNITVNEGIQNDKNQNNYPRIVFWDIAWTPQTASNEVYNTQVTYQTSFFSRNSRDKKLLELKKILNENKIFPTIYHEYIQESNYFHSYFSIDLLENL